MKKVHHITTPEAARLLTTELGRKLMRPFMSRECTLSEAAAELGMGLPALSYRVNQLLNVGLIEVVREERRTGRAIKVYRSSALEYRVPFALTTAAGLEELIEEMERDLTERMHRNVVRLIQQTEREWEVFLSFDLDGKQLSYGFTPPDMDWSRVTEALLHPSAPPVFLSNGIMELTFEEAKALQRTLEDIRKAGHEKRGGQKYLYRLALVPIEPEG